MSQIIIPSYSINNTNFGNPDNCLRISEFFCDTIQGEGVNIGMPAAFLRLQGCTLNCNYCDTKDIWKFGSDYSFTYLFELMETYHLIPKLRQGVHLVITGGSPLLQQKNLILFFNKFSNKYKFTPYIEIENECIIIPHEELINMVSCWNNSPKLKSSGMKPQNIVVEYMRYLHNSWFKFVVSSQEDWIEIAESYLNTGLINKEQVILMPKGANLAELEKNRQLTVELAIQNGVRYCTREHVVLWDLATGV